MTNNQKKEYFVNCLKAIACLLITNSHCSKIYPFSFLAVGGSFGNSIFFVVSGFCLAHIAYPFVIWMKRRIMRVFPTVLLTILISVLLVERWNRIAKLSFGEIIWLYTNKYWFVFAIIIYYPIFYFIFHKNEEFAIRYLIAYFLGYMILYTFFLDIHTFSVELEGFSFFKVYFYFGIFILGGLLNLKKEKIYVLLNGRNKSIFFLMILSIISWVCIYGSILILKKFYEFQFLIHVSVFCFAFTLMLYVILDSNKIDRLFNRNQICKYIINTLSESTLEIYLIQVTFIGFIESLPFPVNFMVFLLCAFGVGIIYHYFIGMLFDASKLFLKKLKKSRRTKLR